MSHTGSVIHPDRSPGLIRMITTGHAVQENNGRYELHFKKPWKKDQDLVFNIEEAQERFVVFFEKRPKFEYGQAVRFNLNWFKHYKAFWGKSEKLEQQIEALKRELPSIWKVGIFLDLSEKNDEIFKSADDEIKECLQKARQSRKQDQKKYSLALIHLGKVIEQNKYQNLCDKILALFDFKFIATVTASMPCDAVLSPVYNLIKDLEKSKIDLILDTSDDFEDFPFQQEVVIQIGSQNYHIDGVKVKTWSDKDCEEYIMKDYNDREGVKREIDEKNEHRMSTKKEIPRRIGRVTK